MFKEKVHSFWRVSPSIGVFGLQNLSKTNFVANNKNVFFSGGFRPQSERLVLKKKKGVFFWRVSPSIGDFGLQTLIALLLFFMTHFSWRASPSLGAFSALGHVQIATLNHILHISGLEMTL